MNLVKSGLGSVMGPRGPFLITIQKKGKGKKLCAHILSEISFVEEKARFLTNRKVFHVTTLRHCDVFNAYLSTSMALIFCKLHPTVISYGLQYCGPTNCKESNRNPKVQTNYDERIFEHPNFNFQVHEQALSTTWPERTVWTLQTMIKIRRSHASVNAKMRRWMHILLRTSLGIGRIRKATPE